MTQHHAQPDADPEALARVQATAAQTGLGAPRACYRPPPPRKGIAVLVMAGVLLVLIAWSLIAGYPALAAILGPALLVVFYVWARHTRIQAKNRGARLDLFEHGLVLTYQDARQAARYDSTSVLQNIIRHHRNGQYTHTTYHYTLTDVAGRKLTLTGGFERAEEWGSAIQQAVTQAQLPTAWATLQAGQRVDFGPLWMTTDQVGSSRKAWPWSKVQEIRVQRGFVEVRSGSRWTSLTTTMVRSIPNYFVFITLAERLNAAHRAP